MKNNTPTEHAEQVQFFAMARAQFPYIRGLLFAVPNGGHRNIVTATKLKAEGVLAGVPDIFCAVANGGFHGLFIEMKRRCGGVVSEAQNGIINELKSQGYEVKICKGCDEAISALEEYLR